MMRMSADCDTMLLVISTDAGDVLGGLLTEKWPKKLSKQYYGEGTCKIWSFHQGTDVKIYSASGVNNYYLLVCETYFAMGSGGNFGIFLVS